MSVADKAIFIKIDNLRHNVCVVVLARYIHICVCGVLGSSCRPIIKHIGGNNKVEHLIASY